MRYFDYSPMYYHASFWPGGLISLFINVLIWGAIVYLFVVLVRKMSSGGVHDNPSPLDIVKTRYAKGEIDKKQFEELKKDLSEDKLKE